LRCFLARCNFESDTAKARIAESIARVVDYRKAFEGNDRPPASDRAIKDGIGDFLEAGNHQRHS
jgi:hypothetical protein